MFFYFLLLINVILLGVKVFVIFVLRINRMGLV